SKFYVHAGDRISAKETRGMGYTVRSGERVKVWDNRRYRSLPVTNFSVILPISVPEAAEAPTLGDDRALVETLTSNDQVAERGDARQAERRSRCGTATPARSRRRRGGFRTRRGRT